MNTMILNRVRLCSNFILSQKVITSISIKRFQHFCYTESNMKYARQKVTRYSQFDQINVKISDLEYSGNPSTNEKFLHYCQFLYHELPIRMSKRIIDLEKMPFGLYDISYTKQVHDWYLYSFIDILSSQRPSTSDQAFQFADLLESIYERHSATLLTLSKGVLTLKQQFKDIQMDKIQYTKEIERLGCLLDDFYLSRIGIRTLLEHEQALRVQLKTHLEGYKGVINSFTSPYEVSQIAIDQANYVCNQSYGIDVPVIIKGCTNTRFSYISNHLQYILFEILKNSMRATIEYHQEQNKDFPPIQIIIADSANNNDIVMKISDQGGGIPKSKEQKIWNYFYTTNSNQGMDKVNEGHDFGTNSPMSGLGYGLPLSRLYARYFGGDLQIVSIDGFGTDCYLHLKRVGGEETSLSPSIRE